MYDFTNLKLSCLFFSRVGKSDPVHCSSVAGLITAVLNAGFTAFPPPRMKGGLCVPTPIVASVNICPALSKAPRSAFSRFGFCRSCADHSHDARILFVPMPGKYARLMSECDSAPFPSMYAASASAQVAYSRNSPRWRATDSVLSSSLRPRARRHRARCSRRHNRRTSAASSPGTRRRARFAYPR